MKTNINTVEKLLKRVKINIKDANGEYKKLDVILEEMSDIWEILSDDFKNEVYFNMGLLRNNENNIVVSIIENVDEE